MKPTYNPNLSYEDNYRQGPQFSGSLPDLFSLNANLPPTKFLGKRVNSTLGVPAGPLLNSAYIKLYAALGFDVLTYKTVRTRAFPCHPYPNVRPVKTSPGWYSSGGPEKPLLFTTEDDEDFANLSITNSFGMPSRPPETWRNDVEKASKELNPGQSLVVSVVGTSQPGEAMENLALDYALAAGWAKEAGADAIEANLSCPNVCSGEGSLFQDPAAVKIISKAMKETLGKTPFLLKLGRLNDGKLLSQVVKAAYSGGAAGLSAINTIPARVMGENNEQALPGEGRLVSGICGAGIKEAGLEMLQNLVNTRASLEISPEELTLIGVGGVMTARGVVEYFELGADGVQSGTGAMWNPYLAKEFKELTQTGAFLTPARAYN